MDLRGALVALIVAATAAFVVGVALERGRESGHHGASHSESAEAAEIGETRGSAEVREELRPLGLDVEAWPFVVAAAAGIMRA